MKTQNSHKRYLRKIRQNKRYFLLPLFLIVFDIYFVLVPNPLIIGDEPFPSNEASARIASKLYLVHGYESNNSAFIPMIEYLSATSLLNHYETKFPYFFDYYRKYLVLGFTTKDINNFANGISLFATDFYEELITSSPFPTQIDIIAHSLGGLIVREMLRLHRHNLLLSNITIRTVVTLGSPHLGSKLSTHPLRKSVSVFIDDDWDTKVIDCIAPRSTFMKTLNSNPKEYMNGILWYLVGGVSTDPLCYLSKRLVFDGVPCDGLVDWPSALAMDIDIQFSTRVIVDCDHTALVSGNNQKIIDFIYSWLSPLSRRTRHPKNIQR